MVGVALRTLVRRPLGLVRALLGAIQRETIGVDLAQLIVTWALTGRRMPLDGRLLLGRLCGRSVCGRRGGGLLRGRPRLLRAGSGPLRGGGSALAVWMRAVQCRVVTERCWLALDRLGRLGRTGCAPSVRL